MSTNGQTEARKLHAQFKHPIIDADGHWAEYGPLMREEFRGIGGDAAVEALDMAPERRRRALCRAYNVFTAEQFRPYNDRIIPAAIIPMLFSSDIGHFDVPDMTEVVPEAYELVEHGLLTGDDFRDFMFANAVRFWGEVNPDFFKGTVVEKQAADVLAASR